MTAYFHKPHRADCLLKYGVNAYPSISESLPTWQVVQPLTSTLSLAQITWTSPGQDSTTLCQYLY